MEMSRTDMMYDIVGYIVPECYYERMIHEECSGIDSSYTYNDFIIYNYNCLSELSDDDIKWMWDLCRRINSTGLMDMESCAIFQADSFFFDTQKKIIIVNPR